MPNPNPSKLNPFDFKLIANFPGYNSATDKTKLLPGFLIRGSKNVYKKISGTIATRPGLKRRGSADATDAGVKSEEVWQTSVGTIRPLRVCNNKLQVESDILVEGTYVWYDLLETSTLLSPATSLTRFVFDTWWDNDDKTDRLVFVRGSNDILSWSGAMAKVASTTATTITKSGAETFAEVGFALTLAAEKKIVINAVEYTYTGGEGTDTLTGVTPSPVAVPLDAVIIQSVMVTASKPIASFTADFIKTIGNQVWVGSYSSRIVFVSCDITIGGTLGFLNYTNAGTLVFGDPDAIILDSPGKGIGVSSTGKVLVFSGSDDLVIVTPNDNLQGAQTGATTITGGTGRQVLQKIEKKKLAGLTSALGHEFIGNIGEHLVWLDQKQRLRALGAFSNVDSIKPINLSLEVQTELTEDDFTGGHLKVVSENDGDTVYLTAPNTGRDWMYQIREIVKNDGSVATERLWHPPQVRGISRFSVIDSVTYGHSNVNPQLYQVWDTNQWFDDSPGDEPIPYVCVARFAYQQHGRRQGLITFNTVFFEGYMVPGLELNGYLYLDYQGTSGKKLININSVDNQASFFMGGSGDSIGDSSLGDNPLGDGIIEESNEQDLLPKFRAITDVSVSNFFEYSLEVFSYDADSRWELLCFGTNAEKAIQDPTFIRK